MTHSLVCRLLQCRLSPRLPLLPNVHRQLQWWILHSWLQFDIKRWSISFIFSRLRPETVGLGLQFSEMLSRLISKHLQPVYRQHINTASIMMINDVDTWRFICFLPYVTIVYLPSPVRRHLPITSYGDRSFAACRPSTWNSLPAALRSTDVSVETFRTQLKTFLFNCW